MKKAFAFLLLFSLCLSLYACSTSETELESTASQEQSTTPSFLKQEENKSFIILPISNQEIRVDDQYKSALDLVTYEQLKSAEEMLNKKLSAYSEDPAFYLSKDSEGYLCLTVEVIQKIDPPNIPEYDPTVTNGCNIDHRHVFFQERISK